MRGKEDDLVSEAFSLSLIRGDALFRLQRRLGLVPPNGLGLVRRALFWSLVAWLPVAAWSAYAGRISPGLAAEPLFSHFGVQVRCLVAIPLMILAEGPAHAWSMRILPQFVAAGVIPKSQTESFRQALTSAKKLREATLPWVVVFALVIAASSVSDLLVRSSHEVVWGVEGDPQSRNLGFGGLWFLYVSRPIYFAMFFGWMWRLVLLTMLCARIAKLELALVPTHPDRAGGLGFLENIPKIFALVVIAVGSVLASRWAHDIVYHDVHVSSLRVEMIAFVVVSVILFSLPLFAFVPLLIETKRKALLEYGALIGRHGRLVHERWILGRDIPDESLIVAPELGPIADTGAAYAAVAASRVFLLGKISAAPLIVAAGIPMLAVLSIEIPLQEIVAALAKAVF